MQRRQTTWRVFISSFRFVVVTEEGGYGIYYRTFSSSSTMDAVFKAHTQQKQATVDDNAFAEGQRRDDKTLDVTVTFLQTTTGDNEQDEDARQQQQTRVKELSLQSHLHVHFDLFPGLVIKYMELAVALPISSSGQPKMYSKVR